jgi:hypothetical protein
MLCVVTPEHIPALDEDRDVMIPLEIYGKALLGVEPNISHLI